MVKTTRLFAALLLAGALFTPARAAETEVREFSVSVDGKSSGTYTMTITKQDDGTFTMVCQAEVRVKFGPFTGYRYTYNGTETWKDGRVHSLESDCDDNGTKFRVRASSDGKGNLRVKVNGAEKDVRGDVYLTTAWFVPAGKQRDGAIPLIDADTGNEIDGKMQPISTGKMNILGKPTECARYRLTTLQPHDIWYDSAERMVRQEWVEDGHKTILELTKVSNR
jgi:hypothetical protein